MKDFLKFTGKVLLAMLIINALTDLVPSLFPIIDAPVKFVRSLFGKATA